MARPTIPNPLERRHLIEKEMDPKAAAKIARAYLDAGRTSEALDFLAKADDVDTLEQLAKQAAADGDPFQLQWIARLLGTELDRDTWIRCADAAEASGKARYAATARRNATRSEG
ncbi:MAG: hypothetical protein GY944_22635 [bacterium]|nr:hypothetical protein [bacterium]MCP5043835.1 hypothetical protein [bacterium]